jgi:hypothetical protein
MPPEVYPMPSFPTLTVSDLAASTRWYRDVLYSDNYFSQ